MEVIISVIMPIYQVEKYIEKSIKSICDQTFKSFEVILVNDGSRDNSILLAENILKNKAINYKIINQENSGVSVARNIGIKESKGKWVICIDPDDIVSPFLLESLYLSCVNSKSNVSFCNYEIVTYDSIFKEYNYNKKSIVFSQKQIIKKFLKRSIIIISPSMLINKEFLVKNDIFYNENIRFSEDQYFIWRVLFKVNYISYIDTPLYNYFIRENSTMTSSNIQKIMTGYHAFVNLEKELNDDNKYKRKILPRWIFGVLRSSTKMLDYEEYKLLVAKLNYKKYIKELICFPDFKVKILSIVMIIDLKLFYKINKRSLRR